MTLHEFISEQYGGNVAAFAKACGFGSRCTPKRYLLGAHRPSAEAIERMRTVTGDKVDFSNPDNLINPAPLDKKQEPLVAKHRDRAVLIPRLCPFRHYGKIYD